MHKIMDRTFVPKYGTVCQVVLQLVVACFSLLKGYFMTVLQVDYVFTEKKNVFGRTRSPSCNS